MFPLSGVQTDDSDCSHGIFSPQAFDMLRNHLIGIINISHQKTWPEKIFLRRNSGIRNVVNADEVEKFLLSKGFTVVEPEKLMFWQQVGLFYHAKTIVSASGAALANMIFAPNGAKVFILISKHPDTIYWYWQDIACASGKAVNYVFGKISDSQIRGVHASYVVDLADLESMISEIDE